MTDRGANGGPNWLRAAVLLGVPSLIALYLTWQLAEVRSGQFERLRESVERHETARAHDMDRMYAVMYAECLNQAVTDLQLSRCAVAFEGLMVKTK